MSKHDINNDELLKHLQEERERKNSSVPSLVGLIEGDGNAILTPTVAYTMIAGLISIIIAGTAWVIRTDNSVSDLQAENALLRTRQEQLYNEVDAFKDSFKNSVQDNMKVSSTTLSELSTRVTELYTQITSEEKIAHSNFEQRDVQFESTLLDLKQQMVDLKSDIRDLSDLETQIKILEIRYENLTKE